MGSLFAFLRRTIVAGVFVLVPLMVLVYLFERLWRVLRQPVSTLAEQAGAHRALGTIGITLLTVLAIAAACFAAGLLVRLAAIRVVRDWLERGILRFVPGYEFVKHGLAERLGEVPAEERRRGVLVEVGGAWQAGLLVEEDAEGRRVVWVPGAPRDGAVYLVDEGRIRRLEAPLLDLHKAVQDFGKGLTGLAAMAAPPPK